MLRSIKVPKERCLIARTELEKQRFLLVNQRRALSQRSGSGCNLSCQFGNGNMSIVSGGWSSEGLPDTVYHPRVGTGNLTLTNVRAGFHTKKVRVPKFCKKIQAANCQPMLEKKVHTDLTFIRTFERSRDQRSLYITYPISGVGYRIPNAKPTCI